MRQKKQKMGFILLFCLCSIYFYFPVFIPPDVFKATFALIAAFLLFKLVTGPKPKNPPKLRLKPGVVLIIAAIFFSIIPAFISRGQSPVDSAIVLIAYVSYFFYFYLVNKQPDVQKIERLVIRIGILTAFLYVVALALYPRIIFGNATADEINTNRGLARIGLGGFGFVHLSYYIVLNKWMVYKKKKWLLYAGGFLFCIMLTLTRQLILVSFILGLNFLLSNMKLAVRIALVVVIGVSAYLALSNVPYVQKLTEQTENDRQEYSSNIRVISGTYFINSFSPDALARIFGNGEPAMKKSNYGKEVQNLKDQFGFFMSDVGFVGLYAKFGIFVIVGWVIVFIRTFKTKMAPSMVYGKYFMAFLILTAVTSSTADNYNFISAIAISFYLIERAAKPKSPEGVLHPAPGL